MADVLIYGAGAIGSFLGYILAEVSGKGDEVLAENVALLGRNGHILAVRDRGLFLDSIDLAQDRKTLHFLHCFASLEDLSASDFYPEMVIVCVKTHSLPGVCQQLQQSGLLEGRLKSARFILLMNGMGNREAFMQLDLPVDRVLEGITSLGVRFAEDGRIELKGTGKTILEEGLDEGERRFLEERFSEKGLEIEFAGNFKEHQYNKLFVNAVINPITALVRQKNSIVLSPELKSTVQSIVAEAVKVAAEEGIVREEKEVEDVVYSVAGKTAANTSSMLQDVLRGRKTEIEAINGYIIRQAKRHGIEVPVNQALYGLVKAATDIDL
jgi:2-dehydropantoate 2-reductase